MISKFQSCFFLPLTGILLGLLSQACLAGAPTPEELANATISGIEAGPVTLTDGLWEGEPYAEGGASFPSVGLVKDFYLAGDMNGDGADEAVILLWQSSGGSGTFHYVAVMDRKNDAIRSLGTAEIGDRVQVRSGRIEDGLVVLKVVQHSEDDGSCCPSQLATRNWFLAGKHLNEGEAQITGTLSLATLADTKWVLTHLKPDEAVMKEAEVTLFFEDGRVSGKSACNRYSAGVEQGEAPNGLNIGLAMGTRMACPDGLMYLEQQYLEALSQVSSFSFLGGKLVLNWGEDDSWSAMFFAPP